MTDADAGKAAAALLAGRTDAAALRVRVRPDGNHFRRPIPGQIVAVGWPPSGEYVRVAVGGDVQDELPFAPAELLVPGRTPTPRGHR